MTTRTNPGEWPEEARRRFGELIRQRRNTLKMKQSDLASLINYNRANISKIETGIYPSRPTKETLDDIKESLKFSDDEIAELQRLAEAVRTTTLPGGSQPGPEPPDKPGDRDATPLLQRAYSFLKVHVLVFPMQVAAAVAGTTLLVAGGLVLLLGLLGGTEICGVPAVPARSNNSVFLRTQGVSAYTVESTSGAMLNNRVRTVAVYPSGVFLGFFGTDQNPTGGLTHYDKKGWSNCSPPGVGGAVNVNAILRDSRGKLWVATDGIGVLQYDRSSRLVFDSKSTNNTLDNRAYGLTEYPQGSGVIWVATWKGVARFEDGNWSVPYSTDTQTLGDNPSHAIAFERTGNIWVGHIEKGVSFREAASNRWHYFPTAGNRGGQKIRAILIQQPAGAQDVVWIATADGGVSRFANGMWTTFRMQDGLPSDDVRGLAQDRFGRVWVATRSGVVYREADRWAQYTALETNSISIGPPCSGCPYDEDQVLTATQTIGFTHARLPYPADNDMVELVDISFHQTGIPGARITPTRDRPFVVRPGEEFRALVTVSPRGSHLLREDRGDQLVYTGEHDGDLWGPRTTLLSAERFPLASRTPSRMTVPSWLLCSRLVRLSARYGSRGVFGCMDALLDRRYG